MYFQTYKNYSMNINLYFYNIVFYQNRPNRLPILYQRPYSLDKTSENIFDYFIRFTRKRFSTNDYYYATFTWPSRIHKTFLN